MFKKLLILSLMLMAVNIPMLQAQHANNSSSGAVESSASEGVRYETPAPAWFYEVTETDVVFTAVGEGTVTLYIQYIDNWSGGMTTESYSGEGAVNVAVPRGDEDTFVNIWASALAFEDAIPGVTGIEYYILIPALLPVPEVTESPVITYEDTGDGVTVTATGYGYICLYWENMMVADGYEYVVWQIPYCDDPNGEMYTIVATAQEDGKEVSDAVIITVYVPGMPVPPYETPAPDWTYDIMDDAVIFTATGEGTVTLYIQYIDNWTGEMTTEFYSGEGYVTVAVPRTAEDTYVNVWASAQADEDAIPGMTDIEYYIVIPAKQEIPPVHIGDADGDGEVAIADVTVIIDYLLSGDASGINLVCADFDCDGEVSIADVSAIIDYLLNSSI